MHPLPRARLSDSVAVAVSLLCVGAGSAAPRLPGMADLTRGDVEHLARLARIDLSDRELDTMVGELGVILESVATVQQAPTEGVVAMSHPLPLVNVSRPDEVRPSLSPQAALSGAPEVDEQRFSVPRILDQD